MKALITIEIGCPHFITLFVEKNDFLTYDDQEYENNTFLNHADPYTILR